MIEPKKSLGQNFLTDKNIVKKIINSVDIKNHNILEIGSGLGALTDEIIKLEPINFLALEKDKSLCDFLIKKLNNKKIFIINKDALKYDYSDLSNFEIISNLPYNISSKFLLKVIKLNKNFNTITCMIQSELADKFNYKFGKMNKYKFLSKYCSEFEILFNVSPNVFYPKPKINSRVVRFKLNNKQININKLDLFIKLFFINKRKKIKSNKNFAGIIDDKFSNFRFEDLNYNEILSIYERFNF